MALVVEDGTGLANADSYISIADADAYVVAYQPENYLDWTSAPDTDKEVVLRKAAQWLDTTYVSRWKGSRIDADMALDWPRYNVIAEGALIDSNVVPERLRQAQVEAAIRFLADELDPDVAAGTSSVKRESKELGPLKKATEFFGAKTTAIYVPKVDALLSALIFPGGRLTLA